MRLVRRVSPWALAAGLALAVALASASPSSAFGPRVPQIAFPSASLQGYLNGVGESINVLTDQVDAQTWVSSISGNSSFTLMIELAGSATFNSIGVYNAGDPSGFPPLFQIFPGAAAAGWFATAHFSGAGMVVTLFDQLSVVQGQTAFPGVDASNFGFYIHSPGGTFYSQDYRNLGHAHVLTYLGTGRNFGDWWECFEDLPWSENAIDFDDAVLLLQSVAPTPAARNSWGAIKSLYLH